MPAAARLLALLAALIAIFVLPATALGHAELVSSSPEAGQNLKTAPTEVTITFDDELDPDLSSFTVTDANGNQVGSGEVDLTIADRNVLTGAVTITDPGVYVVGYTVAGIDGHVVGGAFSFGYNADDEIPPPGEENPDTALPHRDLPLLGALGGLILAAAGLIAVRRLAVR